MPLVRRRARLQRRPLPIRPMRRSRKSRRPPKHFSLYSLCKEQSADAIARLCRAAWPTTESRALDSAPRFRASLPIMVRLRLLVSRRAAERAGCRAARLLPSTSRPRRAVDSSTVSRECLWLSETARRADEGPGGRREASAGRTFAGSRSVQRLCSATQTRPRRLRSARVSRASLTLVCSRS